VTSIELIAAFSSEKMFIVTVAPAAVLRWLPERGLLK
jgi:hypothetical protein